LKLHWRFLFIYKSNNQNQGSFQNQEQHNNDINYNKSIQLTTQNIQKSNYTLQDNALQWGESTIK
jgi:hypothetical protein